jgi:hypothetical protein
MESVRVLLAEDVVGAEAVSLEALVSCFRISGIIGWSLEAQDGSSESAVWPLGPFDRVEIGYCYK